MDSEYMEKLERRLLRVGNMLENPPPSVTDLLRLLYRVERFLSKVDQIPLESIQDALSPSLKALIDDKLTRHLDVDVKVAVASCITQITRITAPDHPYDDDQMKEVFRLIVSSFENLYDESSRSYAKRTSILVTVAQVRSCLIMLDLECDALIAEMFQHFMKTIREHHPEDVFSSMETIMNLVLQESEDISLDLLRPIIDSVKKDNKEVLPIARRLGERVLESSATRLQPYLVQAVHALGISLDDYSDVLASICQDTSSNLDQNDVDESQSAEQPVEESAQVVTENAKEAEPPQQDDPVGDRSPKSVMSNGIAQAGEDDAKSLIKPDDIDYSVQSKGDNLSGNEKPDDLNPENVENKKQKPEQATKRRGRKPSSLKRAEPSEGSYLANEKDAEKKVNSKSHRKEGPSSHEGDSAETAGFSGNNNEINAKISSPKAGHGESGAVASSSPSESIHDESCSSAKKGLGRCFDVKLTTGLDAVKKGSGSHLSYVKKTEERNKGNGGSSLRQSEDKKRSGRRKGNPEKGLAKSCAKDEDKEMLSLPKSAMKSTKDHLEETPQTNLKRKRTPRKKREMVSLPKSAMKSTKDHLEETPQTNLKRKRTPRKKREMVSWAKSAMKSTKEHLEETPKTNLKRKHTPGKENEMVSLPKSAMKSTKEHLEETLKTNLKRKHTPGKENEMVSLPKSAMKSTKEHLEETLKTNLKRKHTPGKENESNVKKYGDELVGTRVKVWWPEDKTFYAGVVDSFDSSMKKHKVVYDDGDQEVLYLEKEKWKIIQDDDDSEEAEARDRTSHDDASTDIMVTPSQQPQNPSLATPLFKPTGANIDIGWNWNSLKDMSKRQSVTCDFCGKVSTGGITRAKQHQMKKQGDIGPCPVVPPEVKLRLEEALAKKKVNKTSD